MGVVGLERASVVERLPVGSHQHVQVALAVHGDAGRVVDVVGRRAVADHAGCRAFHSPIVGRNVRGHAGHFFIGSVASAQTTWTLCLARRPWTGCPNGRTARYTCGRSGWVCRRSDRPSTRCGKNSSRSLILRQIRRGSRATCVYRKDRRRPVRHVVPGELLDVERPRRFFAARDLGSGERAASVGRAEQRVLPAGRA